MGTNKEANLDWGLRKVLLEKVTVKQIETRGVGLSLGRWEK